MPEEITREQQHVATPSPGRLTRLLVHLLSPARCHCSSIAIFARLSHSPAAGGSAAAGGRGEASAARALGFEAEPAQLGDQPIAVLALDLDAAVLHGTAGPAQALQPRGELLELHLIQRQSAHHGDTLASTPGNFPPDTHACSGGRRRCWCSRAYRRWCVSQHRATVSVSGLHRSVTRVRRLQSRGVRTAPVTVTHRTEFTSWPLGRACTFPSRRHGRGRNLTSVTCSSRRPARPIDPM